MAVDYNAKCGVTTAATLPQLETALHDLAGIVTSEGARVGPLTTAMRSWQAADRGLTHVVQEFPRINADLLSSWRSPADSSLYSEAAQRSQASMTSAQATIGAGASRQSDGGVMANLQSMITAIEYTEKAKNEIVARAEEQFKAARAIANYLSFESGGLKSAEELANEKVEEIRPTVAQLGQVLNALGAQYESHGRQIAAAAQGLRWDGPGSGVGDGGDDRRTPSAATPPGAGPTGAGPTGAGPAGDPGAEPPGTDSPGAEPGAGGEDVAPGAAGPGGEGGGEQPQMPGGGPGLAGSTELPTMPKPPTGVPIPPGGVPTPAGGFPVPPPGGLPLPPIGPNGLVPSGKTKLPSLPPLGGGLGKSGLGAGGGGGLGTGGGPGSLRGLGGDAGGLGKTGAGLHGDQPIARAGSQNLAPAQPATGRPPVAPPSLTGAPGGGAPAGVPGGTPPPMMPPGGGMGGGGGRGAQPGSSSIRPVNRKRTTPNDETPGVPVALRGRTGRSLPGGLPMQPAISRRRVDDRDQPAETLQLLDEELWRVDDEAAEQQTRVRRLAH